MNPTHEFPRPTCLPTLANHGASGKAFWESSQIRQALGTDANPPADARVITPSIQRVAAG